MVTHSSLVAKVHLVNAKSFEVTQIEPPRSVTKCNWNVIERGCYDKFLYSSPLVEKMPLVSQDMRKDVLSVRRHEIKTPCGTQNSQKILSCLVMKRKECFFSTHHSTLHTLCLWVIDLKNFLLFEPHDPMGVIKMNGYHQRWRSKWVSQKGK